MYGLPYGYVVLVATVILAIRHVRSAFASNRSKCLVGGLAAVSIVALFFGPSFLPLAALFLQFAVCIYVIFHQVIWRPEDEHAKASRTLHQTSPSEKANGHPWSCKDDPPTA